MDFDPYATWLGIPADRRPPTYYDLLGMAVDEPDPAAIEQAALRRMSKVRQHQLGPHSDRSQEVLSELALARLDPDGPGPPGRVRRDASSPRRESSRPVGRPGERRRARETSPTPTARRECRRRPGIARHRGSGTRQPANPPPQREQSASSTEK